MTNPDRAFGLAYVCERFHAGQSSRLYRVLCRLRVVHRTDNAARLLPREEWSEARGWAAHYTRALRNGTVRGWYRVSPRRFTP